MHYSLQIVVILHWRGISASSVTIHFSSYWDLPSQLWPLKLVPSRPAYQILWMHFRSITWSLSITQHSWSLPAEVFTSYSFFDTTIIVLLQKKVTENSTQTGFIIIISVIIILQIGLSNKKLHRLYKKSRGRASIRVGSSSVSLGFSWLGFLPWVGFFLRLAGKEVCSRSEPQSYLGWFWRKGNHCF